MAAFPELFAFWSFPQDSPFGWRTGPGSCTPTSLQKFLFWGQVRGISSSAEVCRALGAGTFWWHLWGLFPTSWGVTQISPSFTSSSVHPFTTTPECNYPNPSIYNSALQRLRQPGSFVFQNQTSPSLNHSKSPVWKKNPRNKHSAFSEISTACDICGIISQ